MKRTWSDRQARFCWEVMACAWVGPCACRMLAAMPFFRPLLLAGAMIFAASAHAGKITIAAAADLKFAMDEIVSTFQRSNSADRVDVIYGSSGKFHAQIQRGAPYDLYFSADIAFPRALASRPKVLLSDEATSALDPETTRSILALLRQVNKELGLTVVLITHQMQVIKQVADRVAVIDAGRIVEQGPVIDVFTRPQQAITKSLIDEIVPQELPASVLDHVRHLSRQLQGGGVGQLLRLSYSGERAYQPILSRLIREHGLDLSILHGQIDEIQDQTFGSLAVYASGEGARLQTAIAQLRGEGVVVEEVTTEG